MVAAVPVEVARSHIYRKGDVAPRFKTSQLYRLYGGSEHLFGVDERRG
jgi:hypothetical protein